MSDVNSISDKEVQRTVEECVKLQNDIDYDTRLKAIEDCINIIDSIVTDLEEDSSGSSIKEGYVYKTTVQCKAALMEYYYLNQDRRENQARDR